MKNAIEKKWFQSKKFTAFLIMELLLAGLAVLALTSQPSLGWPLSAFMLAIVLTMGAVAFGFVQSQAALDKYLRGMALSSGGFANNSSGGDNNLGTATEPFDEEMIYAEEENETDSSR